MSSGIFGTKIASRYRVVSTIGEGAMGAVFVAVDEREDERVALKLLKKTDESLRGPQRFAREVRFLSKLVHPNVVDLIDYGRDDDVGVLFFAMELLSGDPVSHLTAVGRTSPALALTVARQAAEGIHSAHELGIVHRDMKPANLMLVPRPDGSVQVKILDFGLAYVRTEERLTDMGSAPGTVSYMPPEQLQGAEVDVRGDLYGLGVVLFEMMTGRKPFPGETQVEIAVGVLRRPAPRLDELVEEVPTRLADLVAQLLHKERDERPDSAEELVEIIADFQRSSELRPPTVAHTGPTEDPVEAWGLLEAIPVNLITPDDGGAA